MVDMGTFAPFKGRSKQFNNKLGFKKIFESLAECYSNNKRETKLTTYNVVW
jgi:hypothetical protein